MSVYGIKDNKCVMPIIQTINNGSTHSITQVEKGIKMPIIYKNDFSPLFEETIHYPMLQAEFILSFNEISISGWAFAPNLQYGHSF